MAFRRVSRVTVGVARWWSLAAQRPWVRWLPLSAVIASDKDDWADSLTKFEEYEDHRRGETQSNVEYINVFDARYRKIEKNWWNHLQQ